jgi:hypothetical protein
MMISPEGFIAKHKNKSYAELVALREDLLAEIREFEGNAEHKSEGLIVHPSPEVRYQCNLEYLSKLCGLIAETYNREIAWGDKMQEGTYQWILLIRDWLEENELYDNTIEKKVKERAAGRQYTFAEHLQGLVGALMTSQRPWSGVVPHLTEIDKIFFHYDAKEIKKLPGSYFSNAVFGNLGREVTKGFDAAVRSVEGKELPTTKWYEKAPMTARFLANPDKMRRTEQDFREELDSALGDLNSALVNAKNTPRGSLSSRERALIGSKSSLQTMQTKELRAVSALQREIKEITKDSRMSGDRKRQLIDIRNQKIDTISKQALRKLDRIMSRVS